MLKRIMIVGMILVFGVMAMPQGAWATVPNLVSFQGRITDASGPIADQAVSLGFDIRNSAAQGGGDLRWRTALTPLTDSNGVFNVILENGTGVFGLISEVDFDQTLYVHIFYDEVWLNSQPFTTVPYAFRAKVAEEPWVKSGDDIYYNEGNVGIGTSSPQAELHVVGDLKVDGSIIGLAPPSAKKIYCAVYEYNDSISFMSASSGITFTILATPADILIIGIGANINNWRQGGILELGTTSGGDPVTSKIGIAAEPGEGRVWYRPFTIPIRADAGTNVTIKLQQNYDLMAGMPWTEGLAMDNFYFDYVKVSEL